MTKLERVINYILSGACQATFDSIESGDKKVTFEVSVSVDSTLPLCGAGGYYNITLPIKIEEDGPGYVDFSVLAEILGE